MVAKDKVYQPKWKPNTNRTDLHHTFILVQIFVPLLKHNILHPSIIASFLGLCLEVIQQVEVQIAIAAGDLKFTK